MASRLHSTLFLAVAAALTISCIQLAAAADPDPLQDFCIADLSSPVSVNGYVCKNSTLATVDDFVFSLAKRADIVGAYQAGSVAGNVVSWPALNTLGLSIARLDFDKGGIIPPHTHPTASELVYVEEGSLYAGFVTQDEKLYAKVLQKGDVLIVPRALIHWQLNVGNSTAKAVVTLNNQQLSSQIIGSSMFTTGIREEVLAKSYFIDEKTVRDIRDGFFSAA